MKKNLEINSGEVALFRSSKGIGKLIQWFENISNWLTGKKKEEKVNHVGIGLGNNLLGEAIESGIVIHDLNYYSAKTGKTIFIYEIPNLTPTQKDQIFGLAKEFEGVPYQYNNFLNHIVNIVTFGVLWPEKPEKRSIQLYCSEYVAMLLNTILSIPEFAKWWQTRPDQIDDYAKKHWVLKRRYVL